MTYLELVKRLRLEAGVSGTGPSSVVDQVGEMNELVEWINSAYQDIQLLRDNWRFMQVEFTFPTISGVREYTPAAAALANLANWLVDDVRVYENIADESNIIYEPWGDFKKYRLIGTVTTGRPYFFSIKPDNALVLSPTPDNIFTVVGEYIRKPHVLAANTDEPIFPSQFHMIIIWRALIYYAGGLAAVEKYEHGNIEYKRLLKAMGRDQLPQTNLWEPLV